MSWPSGAAVPSLQLFKDHCFSKIIAVPSLQVFKVSCAVLSCTTAGH
ncbi:hypothetical protein [Acinetobacter larvae]|nr:hypothetical protein [Acinetobacter larvae]